MGKKAFAAAAILAGATAGAAAVRRPPRAAGEAPGTDGDRPRRSWLAERLDPYPSIPVAGITVPPLPPGRVVDVPGRGEMFVREVDGANGAPVLLLHGWMATADLNWFPLFGPLGEHHPLIAPDHRGHGRGIRAPVRFTLEDCADDAAALLRHVGKAPAVVVGYSMGGPIALTLWRRHPEVVRSLVLGATSLEFAGDRRERTTWRTMGVLAFLLRWDAGRYLLLRMIRRRTGRRGAPDAPPQLFAYRAWAEGEFRRADPVDMAEAGRSLGRFDARPYAGEVDVPVAVVVTTDDLLVPPDRQRALAAATGATVFEFAGDHDTAVLQGGSFAKVTLDAIAAVAGGASSDDSS